MPKQFHNSTQNIYDDFKSELKDISLKFRLYYFVDSESDTDSSDSYE